MERLFSLVLAVLQLVAAWTIGRGEMLILAVGFDFFLLAAIWFPESMGEYLGGRMTSKSPAFMVRIGAWIFLIALSVLSVLSLRRAHW
ncbi:MAG: hypothetical protein K8R69_08945 [Deltaproteobacteria bacterium]|nr:hypothetical protein [Deltaproteobacteria bacterium]